MVDSPGPNGGPTPQPTTEGARRDGTGIAGRDPAVDPLPGLEVGPDDAASMLSDTVLAMSDAIDGEELAIVVSQAVPRGREEEVFELMWRSANPAAQQALEVLGRHHPDKKTAKAARKAAYKARSRPR